VPLSRRKILAILLLSGSCAVISLAQKPTLNEVIDTYVQPYVRSGNFSGVVLVQRDGRSVFSRAFGFADRDRHQPNTMATRFHIASVSMQFTAAAILRLVDKRQLSLDDRVGAYIPGTPGGEKITIRDLLIQRSGLPDINNLADYDEVLQHHQTPASLVAKIAGQPLLFEPGTKYLHEEHSAYNVLALIIEKKTGLPFSAALQHLVFQPLGMSDSGADDDSQTHAKHIARGYTPDGTYGLKPAPAIHWSGKTGNASVYTTAPDEAKWIDALFQGKALSRTSRGLILDSSIPVGYGWFRRQNKRFNQTAYYMNGRSPGFGSFALYLPQPQLTVVVLSNVYSTAPTNIGYDIAALTLELPYQAFSPRDPAPEAAELRTCTGTFQFGPDFYVPNAQVSVVTKGDELSLVWPSGDAAALIPVARDRFIDRSYWEDVAIERDSTGTPVALKYDRFEGSATGSN